MYLSPVQLLNWYIRAMGCRDSLARILKVIRAVVGWVWLVRVARLLELYSLECLVSLPLSCASGLVICLYLFFPAVLRELEGGSHWVVSGNSIIQKGVSSASYSFGECLPFIYATLQVHTCVASCSHVLASDLQYVLCPRLYPPTHCF